MKKSGIEKRYQKQTVVSCHAHSVGEYTAGHMGRREANTLLLNEKRWYCRGGMSQDKNCETRTRSEDLLLNRPQ